MDIDYSCQFCRGRERFREKSVQQCVQRRGFLGKFIRMDYQLSLGVCVKRLGCTMLAWGTILTAEVNGPNVYDECRKRRNRPDQG